MRREMYHTREKRENRLFAPVLCTRRDAWLGHGYYFWDDIKDADVWGVNSKRKTGFYEVYKGVIESENILDTVFSEKDYHFFLETINMATADCQKKTGRMPEISDICRYLMRVAKWDTVLDGVMFSDSPTTDIKRFNYRKRIQLALYNPNSLTSFEFVKEGRC